MLPLKFIITFLFLFICCFGFNSQKHLTLFIPYMYLLFSDLLPWCLKAFSKGFCPVSPIVSLKLPFCVLWGLLYSNFSNQNSIGNPNLLSFVTPCYSFILGLNFLESFLGFFVVVFWQVLPSFPSLIGDLMKLSPALEGYIWMQKNINTFLKMFPF